MRIMPLVVVGTALKLSDKQLCELISTDCRLSHPNPTCCCAGSAYAAAMSYLIINKGDVCGAIQKAISIAKFVPEVLEWINISNTDCSELEVTQCQGFIKWAIILTFWHLRKGSSYEDALRHVVGRGGDTDTNGCIVGGMIAAKDGASAIPADMKKKVLNYDGGPKRPHPRPDWLLPKHLPNLMKKIMGNLDDVRDHFP